MIYQMALMLMNWYLNMVSSNPPFFSVVIPIYNVEKYIKTCLQSVLTQSFTDFEVLMIDDGSQDKSAQIYQHFIQLDRRFKVIKQQNRGLSGARNTGIRHAKGLFIAFLDSDDIWHQDKLKAHYYFHQLHPHIDMSYSQSALIDIDDSPMNIQQTPKIHNIQVWDIYCRNPIGNGSSAIINTNILRKIGFYNDKLHHDLQYFDETLVQSEDVECWIRLASKTHLGIEGLRFPLTKYRINNQGLSSDYKKQLINWLKMSNNIALYAPLLIKKYQHKALGYQLRYITRWAVIKTQKKSACIYMYHALKNHPKMIIEEPTRTLVTLGSVFLLLILPKTKFRMIFTFVQHKLGRYLQSQSH